MVAGLAFLLGFQLAGEAIVRTAGLPLPGPVLGMALLLAAMRLSPAVQSAVAPVARVLLAHLSLLFVPAGVGIVGHLGTLGTDGPALLAAIAASTLAALVAGVWTFVLVRRLAGIGDE